MSMSWPTTAGSTGRGTISSGQATRGRPGISSDTDKRKGLTGLRMILMNQMIDSNKERAAPRSGEPLFLIHHI